MRFKSIRWFWQIAISTTAVVTLSCGPAVGDDAPAPAEPAEASKTVSPVETPQQAEAEAAPQNADTPAVTADTPADGPQPTPAVRPKPAPETPAPDQSGTAQADDKTAQPAAQPDAQPLVPVAEPEYSGSVTVETASFKEVVPGLTGVKQVEKTWGAPKEMKKVDGALVYLYAIEPFERVEVNFFRQKVASLVIRFDRGFPAKAVAEQLKLAEVRPVLISDELGKILGQVYPERGVLFAFQPTKEPGTASFLVTQIVLEPISAEPFILRAETDLDSKYRSSLSDLEQALKLDPANARAHWLKSRVLVTMGDFAKAIDASSEAVRREPENPRYRLTRARVLGQIGRLPEAIAETHKAIETSTRRPHVKARALCVMGDLVAAGPQPDYRRAIGYHMQAVKEADPLAVDRHPAIRLAAKAVMIDAHLGAAHDVAWGSWKEKEKAVTQWLNRANVCADDLIDNDNGSEDHRFRVSTRALAACVGVQGKLDPSRWIKEALLTGKTLIDATEDPARKAQLQWELGMALYDTLQVYQARRDHETASKYGEMAVDYLEEASSQRHSSGSDYLLGRLYFRLGAVHALLNYNHRVAVSWFDKAVPLLQKPAPKQILVNRGQQGETFVSMGVSYWELGQRERALELTEHGLAMMEDAVRQGSLDELALAVPYRNLASMHRQLGADEKATEFENLAGQLKATKMR